MGIDWSTIKYSDYRQHLEKIAFYKARMQRCRTDIGNLKARINALQRDMAAAKKAMLDLIPAYEDETGEENV